MYRRAERCAPTELDAETAASSGTSATASRSAAARAGGGLEAAERRDADSTRPRETMAMSSMAEQTSIAGRERPSRPDLGDAEDGRRDQEGHDRRDAVVPRIRHRREVREHVREQLRERDEREPRREHEEEEQRQTQPDDVHEVVP